MSLNLACAEVTGIECARHYGLKLKNDEDLKKKLVSEEEFLSTKEIILIHYNATLGKGFILTSFILCFSITMFIFCEQVLYAINIAPENAYWTGYMVHWLIPGIILQSINFQLQAFVQAQDIMKPIGVANIITIIICACISHWLTFDLKVGILIFPVCKTIMEIMNFIAVIVCFFYTEKGTVKCTRLADICEDLGKFLKQGFKFICGLYAEFLGFEFNTYLAGLTHNQNQISAFVSWVNIGGFLFTIGLGFSNVTRTRVSNYMGSNDAIKCKNAAQFFTFSSACVGMIFLILVETCRHAIASIYSPLYVIQDIIKDLLIPYGFGAVFEVILGSQNTLMRLTNRAMIMTYIMLVLFVAGLGSLSYSLGFVAGMGVPGMVTAFVIITFLVNTCFFYLLNFRTDWQKCIDMHKAIELAEEHEGMLKARSRANSNSERASLGSPLGKTIR